ncbi:calcium-binding protein [Microvirga sp. TS319]|uniref:calcium-binding protein n=1 Tax=Microvirga sp. TS319 TaxID=3241165 RepID=UPI00351A6796
MGAENTSPLVVGTEGDDFLRTPVDGGSLAGLGGNDWLDGGDGNDTLDGGAGNDVLHGGYGDDTYLWRPEAGAYDVIHDPMGNDTIRIDAPHARLTFMRDPNTTSLKIVSDGAVLEVEGYFNPRLHIENIVFSDGTVWHLDDVLQVVSDPLPPPPHEEPPPPPLPPEEPPHQPVEIHGTGGNDLLVGGAEDNLIFGYDGDDTLAGGTGNNLLVGGSGNDTYRWNGGWDVIVDDSGDDTVEIGLDGHLTWSYQVGTDNLLIAADSGETLIVKHFFNPENGIERFTFSNGDVLTRADILERLPFPPHEEPPLPPHEEPPPPHGPVAIVGTEGNDDLQAPTGVSAAMNGLGGDDILIGSQYDDTLNGGAGDDQMIGGSGNDTYLWRPLTGSNDFISDIDGEDTLRIDATAGELTFSRNGNGFSLVISRGNSSLMIEGYFGWFNGNGHIEKIVFSDGIVWHLNDVLAALSETPPPPEEPPLPPGEIHGTSGNDLLVGGAGDNFVFGWDGDDTLAGGAGSNVLVGGNGNDTYRWTGGNGNDEIVDGSGDDTVEIAFDGHLTWSYQVGTDNLLIAADNGSTLIVRNFFDPEYGIERFTFSNGDVLTRADILERLPFPPHEDPPLPPENPPPHEEPSPSPRVIIGTDGDDILIGSDLDDTIDGGAGNDLLKGGSGNDTYIWGPGKGMDVVRDSGGIDRIVIDARPEELQFFGSTGDRSQALIIKAGNDQLLIEGYFNEEPFENGQIETLVFSNGVEWRMADVLAVLRDIPGPIPNPHPEPNPDPIPEPNPDPENPPPDGHPDPQPDPQPNPVGQLIIGTAGNDVLVGGDGNDTLDGGAGQDLLKGGAGNDTYRWALGSGNDTISDASGTDTLSIFANSSEVTLTASGRDFADLTIGLHGQTLVVRDYFVVTASGGYLENIAFADGQVWQVDKVWQALQTRIGGNGNDIIVGNDLSNILKGGSGRDKLNGGKGNDKLFGGHDKDVLTGGAGRDVFVFTKASDAGLGTNRDTITDFKCGFDRIDLSGIDANARTKVDNSFTKLLSGKAKFTAAGQLRYDAKTGILSGNTDKDAAAEFEIQLKSKLHLKLSDFVL